MFIAFKERKPWAIAIITLLLGPFIGAAYVNRGALAIFYLSTLPGLLAINLLFTYPFISIFFPMIFFAIRTVGAMHCFWIAKHRNHSEPLRWYAHWYVLVIPYLFLGFFAYLFWINVLDCTREDPTSDFYCGPGSEQQA